ncbi:MAG: CAP domain-containing protein [Marinosulfonomonas sp.]|nr:CAP domain-containing protein [Marinosulfonomonas sp.]
MPVAANERAEINTFRRIQYHSLRPKWPFTGHIGAEYWVLGACNGAAMMQKIAKILSRHAAALGGLALAMAMLTPSIAATTCVAPMSVSETNALLPTGSPDQMLFSKAVLGHVNFRRCLEGLHGVQNHSGLTNAAATHAIWMADQSTLSHTSTITGQSTVTQRVKSGFANATTGAENIGFVHRYRVDEGQVFYAQANTCNFTTGSGHEIERHSYDSLAERIVTLWMNSPEHRRNLFDRDASFSGTALAFDPNAAHCGVYYMSQEFAG